MQHEKSWVGGKGEERAAEVEIKVKRRFKSAMYLHLGEAAVCALALKAALAVGVFGVGVLGIVTTGRAGARVMGSPSNALGTPNVFAAETPFAAVVVDGLGAGGERWGTLEGVVVGRVKAAAAAMALPRGVFLGVIPLRNTCTRANS
jgi:hypothetical protein